MKWRPISELSDEQRDGRWWYFASKNKAINKSFPLGSYDYFKFVKHHNLWICTDGSFIKTFKGAHPCISNSIFEFTCFLSEPLPDFPKPPKMEWRKFEDEMPPEGEYVLMQWGSSSVDILMREVPPIGCDYVIDKEGKIRFEDIPFDDIHFWMPIVPPEDE